MEDKRGIQVNRKRRKRNPVLVAENLLVTGSRKATQHMLDMTDLCVKKAVALGWHILVGDASGVDFQVAQTCHALHAHYDCYGITQEPRWIKGNEHIALQMTYHVVEGDFLARDRAMVLEAYRVLAIWDGHSRGTKYTYDFAVEMHKIVYMRNFDRAKQGLVV